MKLQNLLIIFIIIALPVIIILSVYIEYQVDTAILRASYDSKLLGATYDTMLTFQLNSTNNKYSTVSDSLIRDLEATINVFSTSLATALGLAGSSQESIMNYVPALVFTLYDGYYIYTPANYADGTIDYQLKPYVYYTKEYSYSEDKKLVINYTLDNYVVVYYDNKADGEYTSKAGYLEVIDKNTGIWIDDDGKLYYKGVEISRDEEVRINAYSYNTLDDGTITDFTLNEQKLNSTSAYDYYRNAYDFTLWYNSVIEDALRGLPEYDLLYIDIDNNPLPDEQTDFNSEKGRVIEETITSNLIQAMEMYSQKTTVDFAMPEFTGVDWDKITHNVCVISFLQGFPVGTTTYNNYVIVPSTENEQYVSETSLYYIGYGQGSDGRYHRLGCTHLQGETIVRI